MPTTITKSIGTTGRDYSTIASFEAAIPADITASDEIWVGECYNDSEFLVTAAISFSGSTTDATRYIVLKTAAGQSFRDHANKLTNALRYNQSNGVGIRTTTSYIDLISVAEDNVRFEGLQIQNAGTNGSGNYAWTKSGTRDGLQVRNCIIERSGAGHGVLIEGANSFVVNSTCVMYTNGSTIGNGITSQNSAAAVIACTVLRPTDATTVGGIGARRSYNTPLFQDVAVFGDFTTHFGAGAPYHASSGYNATDAATAPGSNNQTSLTTADQLEDTASLTTYDLRAKSGGALVNNGTRANTYTNDEDIVGQARSTTTPTIGAWEYVAAGGLSIPIAAYHYNHHLGSMAS